MAERRSTREDEKNVDRKAELGGDSDRDSLKEPKAELGGTNDRIDEAAYDGTADSSAFLDNSGDIVLDADITEEGRERAAKDKATVGDEVTGHVDISITENEGQFIHDNEDKIELDLPLADDKFVIDDSGNQHVNIHHDDSTEWHEVDSTEDEDSDWEDAPEMEADLKFDDEDELRDI